MLSRSVTGCTPLVLTATEGAERSGGRRGGTVVDDDNGLGGRTLGWGLGTCMPRGIAYRDGRGVGMGSTEKERGVDWLMHRLAATVGWGLGGEGKRKGGGRGGGEGIRQKRYVACYTQVGCQPLLFLASLPMLPLLLYCCRCDAQRRF